MSSHSLDKENIKFDTQKEYNLDNYGLKVSFNNELMLIEVQEKENALNKEYNIYTNLEKLKQIDNFFSQFTSLSEVNDSFEELINMNCLSIAKEENNLKINIKNPLLKKKEFIINIPKKEQDIKNEIESILLYVKKLNDKINMLEKKYDDRFLLEEKYKKIYENKIIYLENKIKCLEDKNQLIEKDIFRNKLNNEDFDSEIIDKKDLIFVQGKLMNYLNKIFHYTLIYRATRDGPKTSDFNKKCNGKNNQLIILKTNKGLVFGGFTGRGFQNTNDGHIKDDSVFLFSADNKKIYEIRKGSDALYEYSPGEYGVFFGKCDGNNPIYLGTKSNMLSYNSYTCTKDNKDFIFIKDYELNNGEKYFNLSEIEVFQITTE